LFELEPGGAGWQRLFEPAPAALTVSKVELVFNEAVNAAVRDMISARLTAELGGRAPFERAVASLDAGGSDALDASVLSSGLLVVPATLEPTEREAWFDALVFAHAAALRREATQADAAAYGQTLFEVLATVGWVTSASTSGSPSAREVSSGDGLLATMAAEANAEPWLRGLGLLGSMP
jgi:hypothetical protein